jgi:hypothetical protein
MESAMKYIWLIEDYSRSNDGEAEYYGFCESKKEAGLKAEELNLARYVVQKLTYDQWVTDGKITTDGSRPANPESCWEDAYEVVKVPLV